jgi:sugar transferase (PEP-CTERM/EpsH1 system associated)
MKDLLFLAHRIPFPPNKGDKIRSFHLLRYLAEHYRVHLGAFVDAGEDWQYEKDVRALCASLNLLPLNPTTARVRSARGLLTRQALSFPYYRDARMAHWVRGVLERGVVSRAFVFSSQMAQYLPQDVALARVVDFCDVDSAKWEQYAVGARWPMSWVYRREAALLAEAEATIASEVDAALFVSSAEAALFRSRAPRAAARVHVLTNGVDHQKFDPQAESFARPAGAPSRYIVFTGAMDYWANVDAVAWFASEVLPTVRASIPDMGFAIVGSRPTADVQQLKKLPGVIVTGSVPDVRPWISHAQFVVAPLRIARGIQNKVLEGMAMAQPVVATPSALEGIAEGVPPGTVAAAEEPSAFAAAVVQMAARDDRAALGQQGRAFVREHFDWTNSLNRVVGLLERAA